MDSRGGRQMCVVSTENEQDKFTRAAMQFAQLDLAPAPTRRASGRKTTLNDTCVAYRWCYLARWRPHAIRPVYR